MINKINSFNCSRPVFKGNDDYHVVRNSQRRPFRDESSLSSYPVEYYVSRKSKPSIVCRAIDKAYMAHANLRADRYTKKLNSIISPYEFIMQVREDAPELTKILKKSKEDFKTARNSLQEFPYRMPSYDMNDSNIPLYSDYSYFEDNENGLQDIFTYQKVARKYIDSDECFEYSTPVRYTQDYSLSKDGIVKSRAMYDFADKIVSLGYYGTDKRSFERQLHITKPNTITKDSPFAFARYMNRAVTLNYVSTSDYGDTISADSMVAFKLNYAGVPVSARVYEKPVIERCNNGTRLLNGRFIKDATYKIQAEKVVEIPLASSCDVIQPLAAYNVTETYRNNSKPIIEASNIFTQEDKNGLAGYYQNYYSDDECIELTYDSHEHVRLSDIGNAINNH